MNQKSDGGPVGLGSIPLDAFEKATRMVQAIGCSVAQAAVALAAFGAAAKKLVEEGKAFRRELRAKRPWYVRGRW